MAQVLSLDELDRIRMSVQPAEVSDVKGRRRAELKKLSQDRLQHWPNTLEAARLKKESYLAEKAQREEEARQEVDKVVRSAVTPSTHPVCILAPAKDFCSPTRPYSPTHPPTPLLKPTGGRTPARAAPRGH